VEFCEFPGVFSNKLSVRALLGVVDSKEYDPCSLAIEALFRDCDEIACGREASGRIVQLCMGPGGYANAAQINNVPCVSQPGAECPTISRFAHRFFGGKLA